MLGQSQHSYAGEPVDSRVVELSLGAERFRIPRNYLEAIYAPLNDPQRILRIPLYYPDFTPARGDMRPRFERNDPSNFDHFLIISVLPQNGSVWLAVEKRLENLARLGHGVRETKPAPFGLLEIYDDLHPNTVTGRRRFVADVDGTKLLIDCTDPKLQRKPSQLASVCNYDFPLLDLKVEIQFGQTSMADWARIYRLTTALLLKFKVT